jgi:hypothetical protein
MLQHQDGETQGEGSGAQRAGTAGGGSDVASMHLTETELHELLNTAIARHTESPAWEGDLATLEDVKDIARQINVPEEYVIAAAEEMRRRKVREEEERLKALQRPQRRVVVRIRRRTDFIAWAIFAAVGTWLAHALFHLWLFLPVVVGGGIAAFLLARWLFLPVSDEEADRAEMLPVAGTCRVCGKEAYGPLATFCEEHRYKGPE